MKKFIIYLIALITCISCTDENILEPNHPARKNSQGQEEMSPNDYSDPDYDAINVSEIIATYNSVLGNPLVFDTYEEVDNLLETLNDASYTYVRDWMDNSNFYNPIIDSNIKDDSLFNVALGYYGLTDEDLEDISDEVAQDLYDYYSDLLLTEMPNELLSRFFIEIENEELANYGSIVEVIEPLGTYSDEALCNEYGIFIVDKVVHRLLDGYWITMPINQYVKTIYSNVEGYCTSDVISDDSIVISKVHKQESVPLLDPMTFTDTLTTHIGYSPNQQHFMKIQLEAHDQWGWFDKTSRRSTTKIYNRCYNRRGKEVGERTHTIGSISFLTYSLLTNRITISGAPFFDFNRKQKTYSGSGLIYGHYSLGRYISNVYIFNVSISVSNSSNVSIIYNF